MSESAAARPVRDSSRRGGSVVHPLRREGQRLCARPGCASAGTATLTFQYETRSVEIVALSDDPAPEAYDLCNAHADRTKPPYGWSLVDERDVLTPPEVQGPPADLGSERTVAVLAAALRRDHGADTDLLGAPDEALPDEDLTEEAAPLGADELYRGAVDEPEELADPVSEPDPEPRLEPEPHSERPVAPSSPAPGWQVPAANG